MSVVGSISIRDKATAVLKNIRKEQSLFRKDTKETKKQLSSTWDKTYKAKLNTRSAVKQAADLKRKVNPLKKGITTVIKVKDVASVKAAKVTGKLKSLGRRTISPVIKAKDKATAVVSKVNGKLKSIGRRIISPVIKAKDKATAVVSKVSGKLKAIGSRVITPVVKLKDQVSSGISKIKGKLAGMAKKMVIPVAIAATAGVAALSGAVKSGMQLENQQVSMEHFIGATNKGMDESAVKQVSNEFTNALRENSNATPFETGEVIAAGTRALSVASGNTEEAMSLVKLSEDMAAASGGTKTISDAMEALADAKMGETERLKEFGFKVSAEEFDSKGFAGVSADLQDFYGGAAEKLSKTGSGLMSTIKGKLKSNFADFGLNLVNKLSPVLQSMVGTIDKAQPAIEAFGTAVGDKIGKGIQIVTAVMPSLISIVKSFAPVIGGVVTGFAPLIPQITALAGSIAATVSQVITTCMPSILSIITTIQTVLPAIMPVISTVITTVGNIIAAAAPVISGLVSGIGIVVSELAPVFSTIFSEIGEKVGSVLGFVGERMGFIQEVIGTVAPIVGDIISTAWGVISPVLDICISVFKILFSVVQKVFPGIQKVIETAWSFIKPIVEGIGDAISLVGDGISWISDKITGGGGEKKKKPKKPGKNAAGDNNWRGGVTWVGENGPELVELPKGTRILPNKESVSLSSGAFNSENSMSTVKKIQAVGSNGTAQNAAGGAVLSVLQAISMNVHMIAMSFGYQKKEDGNRVIDNNVPGNKNGSIQVTISKIADTIIVREESDIDMIADAVAKKMIQVAVNMA